jgi:hypothetical protein
LLIGEVENGDEAATIALRDDVARRGGRPGAEADLDELGVA